MIVNLRRILARLGFHAIGITAGKIAVRLGLRPSTPSESCPWCSGEHSAYACRWWSERRIKAIRRADERVRQNMEAIIAAAWDHNPSRTGRLATGPLSCPPGNPTWEPIYPPCPSPEDLAAQGSSESHYLQIDDETVRPGNHGWELPNQAHRYIAGPDDLPCAEPYECSECHRTVRTILGEEISHSWACPQHPTNRAAAPTGKDGG